MGKSLKILFIEDLASDIDLLYFELKRNKFAYSSVHVQTSDAFKDALEHFDPDIILSDYSLPSFDGLTALTIKQEISPDIPFIIVSGTIGEENAVQLIKNGATDYVMKDKLFTLIPKINRALEEAQKKREKRIADETLNKQYQTLFEIATLQSHQVRGPIASILGLINLFNFENANDPANTDIIMNLHVATLAFDDIIHTIVEKTTEIKGSIAVNFPTHTHGQIRPSA